LQVQRGGSGICLAFGLSVRKVQQTKRPFRHADSLKNFTTNRTNSIFAREIPCAHGESMKSFSCLFVVFMLCAILRHQSKRAKVKTDPALNKQGGILVPLNILKQ